ncbi:MAG: hypothetical protein J6O61_05635 [Butyrivibrio sp.]|uniref:hypothetical protein n=1 Tax=Butyrivibrio sp. TaxID=28121 RepID=UPI001B085FBF|nr:hypothetical protein [Butyrivibrio sp.]MBO6240307.1 hypothetical protein [Butyrivibrio sp.]
MSIVKHTDKRSGVTYVYESESYWDKEKKQPRSKRTLIGKIDDSTGEIIPTGKSGKKKADKVAAEPVSAPEAITDHVKLLAEKDELISQLKAENRRLLKEKQEILDSLEILMKKWS